MGTLHKKNTAKRTKRNQVILNIPELIDDPLTRYCKHMDMTKGRAIVDILTLYLSDYYKVKI